MEIHHHLAELSSGVDRREKDWRRGETTRRGGTELGVTITGWPNKRDKNNNARELIPYGNGFQLR